MNVACASLHGNGQCDVSALCSLSADGVVAAFCNLALIALQQQCNTYECEYDGGDCSFGIKNPWAKCSPALQCQKFFRDGMCDEQCNNADCLFDGYDCERPRDACP